MVLRENVQQVQYLVVEHRLKVMAGNLDALRKIRTLLKVNELLDLLQSVSNTGDSGVLLQISHELHRLLDVPGGVVGSVNEKLVEKISAPLDAVLDL